MAKKHRLILLGIVAVLCAVFTFVTVNNAPWVQPYHGEGNANIADLPESGMQTLLVPDMYYAGVLTFEVECTPIPVDEEEGFEGVACLDITAGDAFSDSVEL